MTTLFISDLHLSPEAQDQIDLTVDFLEQQNQNVQTLYILGDLFNTWLGDDIVPSEFEAIITALKQLSNEGMTIYLMVGNRDFMLGKQFAERAGCILISDPQVINLYGTKTLIMHGDSLCTDDVAYQRYRWWTRSKLLQWCFLHLSVKYRQGISDKIKQKSREQKQFKSAMIMDVNQAEVERALSEFNVTQLIHGHTHRPSFHQLEIDGITRHRIVLGDWDNHISYLKCDEQNIQLVDHRIPKEQSIL